MVDSTLDSLGLDLRETLGLDLEDIDYDDITFEQLFAELGIDDPDGSIAEEYADELAKLTDALASGDAELFRQARIEFKKYYHDF